MKKMRVLGIPTLYAYTLPSKGSSNPIKRSWQRFQRRRNFNSIDCIITNSRANQDQLVRLGVKRRIEVILNGVELKNFYPAADEAEKTALRCRLSCPPEGKMIVSVGAVHPRKGTDLLLQAWLKLAAEIPDAHLFLIGMRHDRNNPKLKKFGQSVEALVGASGVADRIHFSGYVPNVAEYLKAADLFLFPSRIEGMPNAMLEAMACGVPVVACPFIGFSSDLGKPDEQFVLVNHLPEAIAQAAVAVLPEDLAACFHVGFGFIDLSRSQQCIHLQAGLVHLFAKIKNRFFNCLLRSERSFISLGRSSFRRKHPKNANSPSGFA